MTTTLSRPPRAPEVVKARPGRHPRLARTLACALFDDPVFRYIVPDDGRRRRMLPGFFWVFLEALGVHDAVYATEDGTGVALWVPPGVQPVSDEVGEEFGSPLEQLTGVDGERARGVSSLIDEHHPPGAFYSLQFMGIEPGRQDAGLGSSLLARTLERCDQEGVPAYLTATSDGNRRFYERHGFEAGDEYAPPGGPPLWPMWRWPSTAR